MERKRGEFGDGIREGYIDPETIADRNIFLRSALVATGNIHEAAKKKLAARADYKSILSVADEVFDDYKTAFVLFRRIHKGGGKNLVDLRFVNVAKAYVALQVAHERIKTQVLETSDLESIAVDVVGKWSAFLSFCEARYAPAQFTRVKKDKSFFDIVRYLNGGDVKKDAQDFFCPVPVLLPPPRS